MAPGDAILALLSAPPPNWIEVAPQTTPPGHNAEEVEGAPGAEEVEEVDELHPMEVERLLRENPRPKTRAECTGVPRPCPYASCKYHLGLTLSTHGGKFVLPQIIEHRQLERLPERGSCVLDVIDDHPEGLGDDAVADILGVSRLRARQISQTATERVRRKIRGQRAVLMED